MNKKILAVILQIIAGVFILAGIYFMAGDSGTLYGKGAGICFLAAGACIFTGTVLRRLERKN